MRLLKPEDITLHDAVGGKAWGLLRLKDAGVPTPPWAVIPAEDVAARNWDLPALAALYAELTQSPFAGVAVRSSAASEDSAAASLAGVFETRFAQTLEELPATLDAVAHAAGDARVRVHAGGGAPDLAIVVQAGVDAAMAGVLFSADPHAARLDEACAELVYGAGEGLVSGQRHPSRAWLTLPGGDVDRFLPGEDGPGHMDNGLASTLARALLAVEAVSDHAVDMEFVVDGTGGVWFVQARPLTALTAAASLRPIVCATSWFFDQRFSRPIFPITRTTLLPLIVAEGPGSALRMRNRGLPEGALHFYGGQAYLDHRVYRAMFSGAPRWLLSTDLRQIFPKNCYCETPMKRDTLHYFRTVLRALGHHAGDALLNLRQWARFRDDLGEKLCNAEQPLLDHGDTEAWVCTWHNLDELTRQFLALHRWSLLWADYGYRIYRLLLACMPRAARGRIERKLHAELRIVTREANNGAAACVRGEMAPESFRAQFGHRSASLDYAEPTWADLLDEGRLAGVAPDAHTEKSASKGLLSLLMQPLRRALEMREEQRFHWERILAKQRAMLVNAGNRLANEGRLAAPGDVWFLEWEELQAALGGDSTPLAEAIVLRKHARYVERLIPKPVFTGPYEKAPDPVEGGLLRGVGVSAGRVTGTAVVMADGPNLACLPDDAIAVLHALDPTGSVLLPRVRAVVLARGGMLAHAAVLAREYGVPMVTAIDNATTRIENGARITVDGEVGTVAIEEANLPAYLRPKIHG